MCASRMARIAAQASHRQGRKRTPAMAAPSPHRAAHDPRCRRGFTKRMSALAGRAGVVPTAGSRCGEVEERRRRWGGFTSGLSAAGVISGNAERRGAPAICPGGGGGLVDVVDRLCRPAMVADG